jgi:peptidoglycan/xylan/chitin deacetylase (PgdA/CDA1 family)
LDETLMGFRRLCGRALTLTAAPELILRHRSRRRIAVLGYHRILPPQGSNYPLNEGVISASPEEFARELKYLKAHFDVISIAELLRGFDDPSLLPPRPAVITFDDGYIDNHTHALPLLREADLPACFFLCTGLIGTRRMAWQEQWVCCLKQSRCKRIDSPFGGDDPPYERDAVNLPAARARFRRNVLRLPWSQVPVVLERLREATGVNPDDYLTSPLFMSWDAVRELAAAGMDIGGHTRTHVPLSRADDRVLHEEVAGCYDDIVRELGRPPQAFAYPFGSPDVMSEQADDAIAASGFGLCFSFVHGYSPRGGETRRRLPRIHAVNGDDQRAFRLRLATAPDPR